MELKKVAILGPGGNVGSGIISEIQKDESRFIITAITRHTSSYSPASNTDITHKRVDYASFDSLVKVFAGQDAVVNCITGGATQYEMSKSIIDAAIAAGVKFFFANDFVGNIDREQYRRMPESFVGGKVRIREYLKNLASEGKIAWTSLTGGPFFDMWLAKGPAGFDIANRAARIYGTGNSPLCWTPLPTMALAAANMLRNPDPIINRPVHICPLPRLTQNIILKTLESMLNTKFIVEHVDVAKINHNARLALERGEVAKAMKGLAVSNQFYEADSGSDFSDLVENEIVGVDVISVEDAVRDVLERYGEQCRVVDAMFRVEACEV